MLSFLCGLVACERAANGVPTRHSSEPPSGRTDAPRIMAQATGGVVAPAVRQTCAAVDSAISALLSRGSATRSDSIPNARRPRVTRGDTVFAYWYAATTAPGCRVVVTSDDAGDPEGGLFDPLVRRLEATPGWESAATSYSADGPDGSVVGFRRAEVLCIVSGSWDGGDDADSTYVPAPGYRVDVTCGPARSDDVPK